MRVWDESVTHVRLCDIYLLFGVHQIFPWWSIRYDICSHSRKSSTHSVPSREFLTTNSSVSTFFAYDENSYRIWLGRETTRRPRKLGKNDLPRTPPRSPKVRTAQHTIHRDEFLKWNFFADRSLSHAEPALIAKSNIILDVKPWDDETDMKEMENAVRKIETDGLVWGACKFPP